MNFRSFLSRFLFVLTVCTGLARAQENPPSPQPKITKDERARARDMFAAISADVKKHYYDPNFHGLDWAAVTQSTQQAIDASATFNRALSEIAAGLDKLDDSHTFFLPPARPYTHDFGWQLRMVDDHCYVLQVRPNSDAETKGIKRGDEILTLNGFQPTRQSLHRMTYVFNVLRPQPGLHVLARAPEGQTHQADVMAAMRERKKVMNLTFGANSDIWDIVRESERNEHLGRARATDVGSGVMVLKLPSFEFSEGEVAEMMNKVRRHRALVLDLRGNPGGIVDTLKAFIGEVLDHPVKIGDRVTRDGAKPLEAKSRGHNAFTGKLVVLVDSQSASAAEIFARVMQLEKRAIVLGDKTSGAVMEAKPYNYKLGMEVVVFYGASITDADLLMTDGKSLEHVGVTPDEISLPTAADLAAGRDPVLARAVELCGSRITPEAAGALFPYEWPPL